MNVVTMNHYYFPTVKAAPSARPMIMRAKPAGGRPRLPAFRVEDDAREALDIVRNGGAVEYAVGDSLCYEIACYPEGATEDGVQEMPLCGMAHDIGSFICDVCVVRDGAIVVTSTLSVDVTARSTRPSDRERLDRAWRMEE